MTRRTKHDSNYSTMFDRLKHILHLQFDEASDRNQLDLVIEDLTSGIESVKSQCLKIDSQETEILQKLEAYELQRSDKIEKAKQALRSKNELIAENYYQESEILKRQIDQYKRIAREIQETKRKLLTQENQFLLTKDQLSAKKALGEANVDSTQLRAEMSEQLMFLNESNELSKFDELILDANCKSEAIAEIQGSENDFDLHLGDASSALNGLEQLISDENEKKIKSSLRNQQILIERVFGKTVPVVDTAQKEKQGTLLDQLKKLDSGAEKKDRIDNFFKSSVEKTTNKPQVQSITKDKEDRIKNFFK